MTNMSYCAFQNTSKDLRQCVDMMHDAMENGQSLKEFLADLSSDDERRAVTHLVKLCNDVCELYEDMKEDEIHVDD